MTIQEIKEHVGSNAKDIIANGLGMKCVNRKYQCINKFAHNNGDKNPSMSWDDKANHFYCFACGEKLDIYRYYTEFENKTHKEVMDMFDSKPVERIKKTDNSFNPKLEPLTQEIIDYCKLRGLTQSTLNYFNIKSYQGNIALTYEDKGVKYRKPAKVTTKPKYMSVKGSVFELYNKERVQNEDILIVCEGEFDCMVLYECGYTNAVSIPTGAATKLDSELEFFEKFLSVIVVSDNDDAGKTMDKNLIDLLGNKAKMVDKGFYGACKDINELYVKHGEVAVKKLISSGKSKIKGLRNLDEDPYIGLQNNNTKFIPTGIDGIDNELNDLESRRTTLVTGRPAEGKSTFVDRVALNAVDKFFKVLLVDGEHDQEVLVNNLYKKAIGYNPSMFDCIPYNKKTIVEPKPNTRQALQDWHKGKLFLYTKGDSDVKTADELFKYIEYIVKTEKIDLVILDNLMSLMDVSGENENNEQTEFMKKAHNLSVNENCHTILVAHPNKSAQKGESIDFYQVSGTSNLVNLADNIVQIMKVVDPEQPSVNGYAEIHKNRGYGTYKKTPLAYHKESSSLLEIVNGQAVLKGLDVFRRGRQVKELDRWEKVSEDEAPF